jgi:hypothetical protein
MVVGSLGTGELIILLVIAGFIGVPIWAIVRAAKAGRTGWAVGIAVALLVWPISLVSAIVYLTAVHPGTSGIPASAATPVASVAAPGWLADPSGRHQLRYWNGIAWTEHVSDNDVVTTDPPTAD